MTRKSLALAFVTSALAATAAVAQVQQPANYAGVHGGINDVKNWDAEVSFGAGVSVPGQVEARHGAHYGVFGGRQLEHSRWELELQGGRFGINRIDLGTQTQAVSQHGNYEALTANAYRVEPLGESRVSAYGALGVGWGRVSLPAMGFSSGCNCFAASAKSGLTWLARAGLEYNFDANNKAFLQYSFLALPRPGSGGSPGVEYSRKNVGAVSVGYRRAF